MGVVEGRAQYLPAGCVLEGRADPPVAGHGGRVERVRHTQPGQRRAEGPDQEHRLDHVAARLLQRQRGQIRVE
jgi:hypothetical protein